MIPLMVAYGGGINSTAMLVGMAERGIRPDAILFADTGGERPETYAYVRRVSSYCVSMGMPGIVVVRGGGKYLSLESECLGSETLPSLAYGFKRCSLKWKVQPQDSWTRKWAPAREAWSAGERVVKCIGYHAGEKHRSVKAEDDKYTYRYPLREWGWYQEDCVSAVARAGLPNAGKSACFFCPSTKKHEILELQEQHPQLLRRALEIESRALATGSLYSVKGLGRNWAWKDFLESSQEGGTSTFCGWGETEVPCGCYDGGDDWG